MNMDKTAALWATAGTILFALVVAALIFCLVFYTVPTTIALVAIIPLGILCTLWDMLYSYFRWERRNK